MTRLLGGIRTMAEDEAWAPKTREDWVGLFADGHRKADELREEDAAKRAAADKDGKDGKDGKGDSGDVKPKTFAERLLGG